MSLNCENCLSETSNIKICIQDMNWDLHYFLQGLKLNILEELAPRVYDVKLSMVGRGAYM